jgi:hypothetical protein
MSIVIIGPTGEEDVFPAGIRLTLGEALKLFEDRHRVRVTPYDGSWDSMPLERAGGRKYFIFNDGGRFGDTLVDIHVERGGEEICPKQDLDFPLLDGDLINVGVLVC